MAKYVVIGEDHEEKDYNSWSVYRNSYTSALTNQMVMRSISNAEYAAIDDINITVTCYAIGTEDVATNPADAWNECKAIGGIQ